MVDPSTIDRRTVLRGAGLAGLAGVAGCLGSQGGTDKTQVGMVYALGGLGDKSFNDMAHRGAKEAADDLEVEFKNAEPEKSADFKTLQRKFAKSTDPNYDLVTCIGFAQTSALEENASNFADQNFTIVDSVVESDNVASYVFKEHEGSFQVGYLAGLLTNMDFSAGAASTNDDTVVGFVGGKEIPLIKKFEAGYMAGVKHADPDITVRSAYAGSWTDTGKGKEIALSMYGEGADVVYHAAGATGVGVFKAAQEEGGYAIGVDADQSKSAEKFSDVIVASMVKRVNNAVYNSIENVTNDEFKGGSVTSLGLEKNGVEAVMGQQLGSEIPSEVTDKLDQSRQKIIDGDISVPKKPENV